MVATFEVKTLFENALMFLFVNDLTAVLHNVASNVHKYKTGRLLCCGSIVSSEFYDKRNTTRATQLNPLTCTLFVIIN